MRQSNAKKYSLTTLLLFFLVYSVGHAQEHSVPFVSRLVSKYDYSLSPSGNFLLVKEPSASPFHHKHMSLRTIDETGLENDPPASSLKYEHSYDMEENFQNKHTGEVLAVSTFPGTHGIRYLHPSLEQQMQRLLELGDPLIF